MSNYVTSDFDLIGMIERDLGPGKKSGRWVLWRCPFHHPDNHASFAATNGDGERGPFWRCFSAACGKQGGPVKWLEEYCQMSWQEAKQALESGNLPGGRAGQGEAIYQAPIYPPGEKWQGRAWALIERAQAALWGEVGANTALDWPERDPATGKAVTWKISALDWLLSRGLTEQTLRFWKIGFIPVTWEDRAEYWGLNLSKGRVWAPMGILIPCIVSDKVWYLKIRRPMAKPKKYTQIPGGKGGLYMAQTLEGHDSAVFCEGEFDSLLLWQEAGDLAGVVTLGSAGAELNIPTWGLSLVHTKRRFVAYDIDQAGQAGGAKLDWLHPERLEVPQVRPWDKDLTDFARSGGELRGWLAEALARE